jgi:FtsP/CotA-like multicopper oxidase with cupredoxin domain
MGVSLGRRDFVRKLSAIGTLGMFGEIGSRRALEAVERPTKNLLPATDQLNPLRLAPEAIPDGLTLRAAVGETEFGGGLRGPAWMLNDSLPSPLLRVRQGEPFRITLQNDLPDQLILHWHGLTPPEHSDGHPRLAVPTGKTYEYSFILQNRPGTYWYHSHTHHRTAAHTAMGIGGMLIVEGEEDELLGLPSGAHEIPLILQDRQVDAAGRPIHSYANLMAGYLGSEVFVNGIRRPYLECRTEVYRFRLLNGSNARIFRIERSDGRPMVLIGNDGGLLERPAELSSVDLAPGERIDLLVDLTESAVGEEVLLRSAAFQIPGGIEDLVPGVASQGAAMDLLHLSIVAGSRERQHLPERLSVIEYPEPAAVARSRTFELATWMDEETRSMVRHGIDRKTFDKARVDVRMRFDDTEIWSFVNDKMYAHPIHLHGAHFRILSRSGGREAVMPWESGLKDTVLLYPSETVAVAVRFRAHRGLFPLHCHNLEHEDAGMMLNVLVE